MSALSEEQFDEELHESTDSIDHRALTTSTIRRDSTASDRTDILFSEYVESRVQARRFAEEEHGIRMRHLEETFALRQRDQHKAASAIGAEESSDAEIDENIAEQG